MSLKNESNGIAYTPVLLRAIARMARAATLRRSRWSVL